MLTTPTLKELWDSCTGPTKSFRDCFDWAPDVFALSSRFLEESGSYRQAVSPPQGQQWRDEDWHIQAAREGLEWAQWINERIRVLPRTLPWPETLQCFYNTLLEKMGESVDELSADWEFVQTILRLHATCDEAGAGLGVPGGSELTFYSEEAIRMLKETGSLSHFPPQRVRVLPKRRTSQLGIDIRSLSHHLAAIHTETNVKYTYSPIYTNIKRWGRLELLLIPWPYNISADDFSVHEINALPTMSTEYFGFFKFAPVEELPTQRFVELVKQARGIYGEVDMVVLPETALTKGQFRQLETALDDDADLNNEEAPVIVAGVRGDAILGNFGRNNVVFSYPSAFPGYRKRFLQPKHHRWVLDESQIRDYDLKLDSAKRWWEAIEIAERRLWLFQITDWLMLCPLVCEDLARQEPVSRAVRAIGPTLVIALLLDGPQLAQRWPHRYAGVLSDDPSSSVLTVTSLGMAMRCRPPGCKPRPVVAFWNDTLGGYREISLNPGNEALLLSLEHRRQRQWTADGRDGEAAFVTLLEDIHEL